MVTESHPVLWGSTVWLVAFCALGCGGGAEGSKAGGSTGAGATAGVGNAAGGEAGGGVQEPESAEGGQAGGGSRQTRSAEAGRASGGAQEPGRADSGRGGALPESSGGTRGGEAGGAVAEAGAGGATGDVSDAGTAGASSSVPTADAGTSIVGLWVGVYVIDGNPDSGPVPLDVIIDPAHNVYLGLDHLQGKGVGNVSATGDIVVTVSGSAAGSAVTYTGHFAGDSGSGTWSDSVDELSGTWTVSRREGVTVDAGTRAICDETNPCMTDPSSPDTPPDPTSVVGCMFAFVAPSPAAKVLTDRMLSCRPAASCNVLMACYAAGSLADVYVSTSGNDTNSGATPELAKRTLNAAIGVTQADGTVHMAAGTYPENVLISRPLTLQGGYDTAFSRIDPVASPTTIDGRGLDSTITVMLGTASPARVALKDLRVINGLADGLLGLNGGGLRIGNRSIDLDLEDCSLSNNRAVHIGGALDASGIAVTLTRCSLEGNSAGTNGGAMQVDDGTLTVSDCTLEGITANGSSGGAIDSNRSTVSVTGTTIRNNQGPNYGGGINLYGCEAIIDGCVITGNQAALNGGGIYFAAGNAENYAVTDTTVTGNVPYQIGGEYADLGGNTLE